jgi:molecular chaperone GrpE
MAKNKNEHQEPAAAAETAAETAAEVKEETAAEPVQENQDDEAAKLREQLAAEQDKYLRLLAEYDNFRKRSQKEKDNLYTEIRAETVGKFLPVYDNLERALNQPTVDEAYKKGVEMTMGGLIEVMEKLGVVAFGDVGDTFDPNMHNAVMHCEDENLGENVLAEVFQKGFRVGDKVVRFAMVRVAN